MLLVSTVVFGVVTSTKTTTPSARAAFANPGTYNTNSPHWSHIRLADFGRLIKYLDKPSGRRAAVHEWYARHVDMVEVGMNTFIGNYSYLLPTVNIKDYNPTLKTFGYDYDLTTCQHQGCVRTNPVLPSNQLPQTEDEYLHFSEDTTIEFYDLNQQLISTSTITGCPDGQPITSSCRVQLFIWNDYRWLPNLTNSAWRIWRSDTIISQLLNDPFNEPHEVDGVFLDEHGPGFSLTMGIGYQSKILSGGGIREYSGARPRNPYVVQTMNGLDQAHTDDVTAWLTYLRGRLDTNGKFAHINTAEYFHNPLALQTAVGAKGAMTEHLNRPVSNGLIGATQFQQFLTAIRQVTATGGSIDLAGSMNCQLTEPVFSATFPTYTPGNYSSGPDRFKMWQLASYYLAKESPSEIGRLYLNTNLCVTEATTTADLDAQWIGAYEQNVGQPTGEPTVIQTGTAGCGSTYSIFSRTYEAATVLLRPRDGLLCTTYNDSTAVTVPLGAMMQMLRPDGTLSMSISSISLRNGEAVILFPSPDTIAPGAIYDLRAI